MSASTDRRIKNESAFRKLRKKQAKLKGAQPARSEEYLAWIRTLRCLLCGTTRGVEAAHSGPHGLSQKAPDSSALPLCWHCHREGPQSYHKLGRRFFAVNGLKPREILVMAYNMAFEERNEHRYHLNIPKVEA